MLVSEKTSHCFSAYNLVLNDDSSPAKFALDRDALSKDLLGHPS